MHKFLLKVKQHLIVAIPVMMLFGFIFGLKYQTEVLEKLIVPLTFVMVYPMMVTLNLQHLKQGIDLKLQVTTQLINFAIIPFAAYLLGALFFPDRPYLALGLLLTALLPTSSMTVSWTGFAHGNIGAAVTMTIVGLTLGSLVMPFYVKGLLGAKVHVDLVQIFRQLSLIIFLPMLLGYLTRKWLVARHGQQKFIEKIAPKFPPLSTIGMFGIVFIALALKADEIAHFPGLLLHIVVPLLLIYLFNFTLSTLIGKFLFNGRDAVALVYGTVIRNLSISLAIAINAFGAAGSDAVLIISMGYVIQTQAAAWYIKFADRVLKPLHAPHSSRT